MSDYDALDRKITHLTVVGTLATAWAHEMNNVLAALDITLRDILLDLDEINLPRGAKRRLESEIGQAVDRAGAARRAMGLFSQLLRADEVEEIIVADLVRDTVKLLAPIARSEGYIIEIGSVGTHQTIRTQRLQLQQVLINVLLYLVRQLDLSDRLTKIIVSVEHASVIFVASDNPVLAETILSAFEYESEDDLLNSGELKLFIALKLAQDLGGGIRLAEYGAKTAIAIQIPVGGEK